MASQQTSVDLSTRNTLSEQLTNINIAQLNALTILTAMYESMNGKEVVTVDLMRQDGTTYSIDIRSNAYVFSELTKIKSSLSVLTGLEPGSNAYVSDRNGGYRKIIVEDSVGTFNANVDEIKKDPSVNIDNKSIIWNLMFPHTSVSFTLPKDFVKASRVNVKTFRIENDPRFEKVIKEGMSYAEVLHLNKSSKINGLWFDDSYDTDSIDIRYYGVFKVKGYEVRNDGLVKVTLDNIKYSDNRSIENTIELVSEDELVSESGKSIYKVRNVDTHANTVLLEQIRGIESFSDIATLLYNNTATEERILKIPIKGKEKSIIFISPINSSTGKSAEYTKGFVVDTSKLSVLYDGISQDFDSFFETKVSDIGYLIEQMMVDTSIPLSKGVKPKKPFIDAQSLQVVQINKHLSNSKAASVIEEFSLNKERVSADIVSVNTQISDVSERINANKYKTVQDRTQDEKKLTLLLDEKRKLTNYYASIVSDISSKSDSDGLASFSPKFRIRGFFPIQEDIESLDTRKQIIIGYHIEYRYTSPNLNNSESILLTYKDSDGKSLHGTFSSWIRQSSPILKKEKTIDGTVIWRQSSVSDGNEININQIDIPIRPNESVEIRVRAISEAGYPFSELTSDWSDVVKVEFPLELKDSLSLSKNIFKNNEDKKLLEIQQALNSYGIDTHLITSYKEQDKYYAHTAHVISSGFRTSEQVSISLFDLLTNMKLEIKQLRDVINKANLSATVTLVDEYGNVYDVNNYSTITLNAGTYDKSSPGNILNRKFFIKISNLNSDPIQLHSIETGDPREKATDYENVLVRFDDGSTHQKKGQVIYFRSNDISGYEDLYTSDTESTTTVANEVDKISDSNESTNAYDSDKNQFTCGVLKTENLVVFHVNHPGYEMEQGQFRKEVEHVQLLSSVLRESNKQPLNQFIGFTKNDEYLIGANSCGAVFYPVIQDIKQLQVMGAGRSASRQMDATQNSAILIPLSFECRMSDKLGNVLGKYDKTDSGFSRSHKITKKIGVSMLLNDNPFIFDIEVSCTYDPNDSVTNAAELNELSGKLYTSGSITPNIK